MTLAWLSLLTLIPFTFIMHWPGWRPAVAATVPGVRQTERQGEEGVTRVRATARYLAGACWNRMKKTWAHPKKKNNCHFFHILFTKLDWTTFFFFSFFFFALYLQDCFLFLAAQEECERESVVQGGGKLFIWGRRRPLRDVIQTIGELQGLQLSEGRVWQTKYSSHLFSQLLKNTSWKPHAAM